MPKFESQGAIGVLGPYARRNLRGPTGVGPGGAVSAGPAAVVSDTFTANDATSLSGRTPSPTTAGNNWVEQRGTWIITGNKATSSGGMPQVTVDAGLSDCTISVNVRTPASFAGDQYFYGGIYARSSAVNTAVACYFEGAATNKAVVYKVDAGSFTLIAETAFTPAVSTTYALKAVLLGTSIKLYIDDVLKVDTTSTWQQTVTKHGLWIGDNADVIPTAVTWDDFLVTA